MQAALLHTLVSLQLCFHGPTLTRTHPRLPYLAGLHGCRCICVYCLACRMSDGSWSAGTITCITIVVLCMDPPNQASLPCSQQLHSIKERY
jgi:hypothetical protein